MPTIIHGFTMSYMLTRNKRTIVYVVFLLFVGVIGLLNYSPWEGFIWHPPTTTRKSLVSEDWILSEIYIERQSQPLILAVENKLIFLGSDNSKKKSNVLALDINTGKTLWRVNYDGIVITADTSNIIVGGSGEVIALNSDSGEILWRTNVATNVTNVAVWDDKVYINGTASSRYYALNASTGKVLQKSKEPYPLNEGATLGNIVYRKDGNGNVIAISKKTGTELWRVYTGAISNLAVTPSSVYAINSNGNIVRLNSGSGNPLNTIIQFEASSLPHSAENNSLMYSYYVTFDSQSNKLFAYFGDSAQLFAFQLPILP
jgi:outer membrane protein assembly factor BamB